MNRRLIWIIAGVSVLGLGVPAFAAARGGDGTPEDNGVPGDVRGNCDEAEHANDPECLAADPSTTTIVVTVPATVPVTVPATVPATIVDSSVPEVTTPDEGTVPDQSVPENTTPDEGTVPDSSTPVNTVEDISGPCDEAEHANDPRCTGAPRVDNSGPGNIDDDDAVDDNSGSGSGDDDGDDDRSGRGGGDDDGGDDDNSGHGGDDD